MSGGDPSPRLTVGSPYLIGLRYCNGDISLLLEVEFFGAGFHGRGYVRKTVSHSPWLNGVEILRLEFSPAAESGFYGDVEQAVKLRCHEFELPSLPDLRSPR